MAITKTVEIDGKEVIFKASAAIPRIYRIKFGRDIYKDLAKLEKSEPLFIDVLPVNFEELFIYEMEARNV